MTINNNFNILDLDGDQREVVSSNSSKQNSLMQHLKIWTSERHWERLWGKYKTWTPGPWTPSMDRVHGPGPWKYGPGPWTPIMDRVHGPPIFTTPKIAD